MEHDPGDYFKVIQNGKYYQVVLFGPEKYRDQPGNIRTRWVVKRKYASYETPLEAQAVAQMWNMEDGLSEAPHA